MTPLLRTDSRVLKGMLLCLCLAAVTLSPQAAQAGTGSRAPLSGPPHGTTMHETYQVFQTGKRVPGSGLTITRVTRGSQVTLTAPPAIPGKAHNRTYTLLFWDIDGQLYTQPTATFSAPQHQAAFAATAWYWAQGTGPCPGCTPAVTTYGFSLSADKALPASPIKAVVPAGAWTPPSASVATTTSVTITAKPGAFVQWLAPAAAASGRLLSVGAGISTLAIAFYHPASPPPGPNPCQAIITQIDDLNQVDFGPPDPQQEYQNALRALLQQLHACEAQHGGI